MPLTIAVPVLIVGAGGCGLSLSTFLANLGVNFLTIERNENTTDHPRTMEIFRPHGLADLVYAKASRREPAICCGSRISRSRCK